MTVVDLFGPVPAGERRRLPERWQGSAELSAVEVATQRPVYRWRLSRRWREGAGICAFLCLNPSDAVADRNDPSVWRMIHFAYAWGFAGFDLVNILPFRSSSPAECAAWLERHRDDEGGRALLELEAIKRNLAICAAVAQGSARQVLAFGDGAALVPEIVLRETLEAFAGAGEWGDRAADLYCLGLTARGAPKHPMARGRSRVPDFAEAQVYMPGGWLWWE